MYLSIEEIQAQAPATESVSLLSYMDDCSNDSTVQDDFVYRYNVYNQLHNVLAGLQREERSTVPAAPDASRYTSNICSH